MNPEQIEFMREAIRLSKEGMINGYGGPFGAVIVKDGKIVGRGYNKVTSTNDPTAHAEVVAIRDACKNLQTFQLEGCDIYTSCEPCPMCMGAIYWARPSNVFFACTRDDAAKIGFDDSYIYNELKLDIAERGIPLKNFSREEAMMVFDEWESKENKTKY